MQINKGLLAKLALLLATLIWGTSFVVVKDAVDIIPTAYLLAVRFSVACVVLALIFFKKLKKITKEYLWYGLIIGTCLFLAYYIQTLGIEDTTPGKNAFITAAYCVMVPFMFWFISKKKPDKYNITAAVICLAGIGLVSLTSDLTVGKGDALTLLAAVFYALHMVFIAMFSKDKDPTVLTILQFAVTAIFSWIASFIITPVAFEITVSLTTSVLYLALFATAACLLLQNVGQKYTNPSEAAIILSLESVFGVLFSILFYGEKITPQIGIGFVLIFVAIIISETKLSFIKKKSEK
ncbi:MAG: DMT family transporter [Clostridia bacterium]|nr:DMT family transporter [Clostridia bacterium]